MRSRYESLREISRVANSETWRQWESGHDGEEWRGEEMRITSRCAPRRTLDKHQNINTKWKENNLPGAAVKAGESLRRESIAALKRMQIWRELASVCSMCNRVRDRRQPAAIKAATGAIDAVFNPSD